MSEQWRPIPAWEGYYSISDQGRLRSEARSVPGRPGVFINLRQKILKGSPNSNGYLTYALAVGNRRMMVTASRIVLWTFVGPPPAGMEACHNNGDHTDDRLVNLRWDTRSENTHDKVRHGTHPMASKTHCKHGHPFSEANTYQRPTGGRACKTCITIRKRAAREKANA